MWMCIYYPPSYDWKMMGSRRLWYSSTWALFPLKTPAKAKVPHFKYAVKTTQLPKNTVTELRWCSARMFNCNDFNNLVILINFVNGIQFLKTSWQQIPQWKKKNDATRGGIYLLKLYFFHYLLSIPWGLTQLFACIFPKSFRASQKAQNVISLSNSTCSVSKPRKVQQQRARIERGLPSIIM